MARRARGEGTVYQRKDGHGRFEAAFYVPTLNGKRKRQRVYGKTRQEAQEKRIEMLAKVGKGIQLPDKDWKLSAFLDHWLEYAVKPKWRPATYVRHESIVRVHLKPGLGTYRLSRLSVLAVQDYLDRQLASGQSKASVHQMRKVLGAALTWAQRKEFLFRNVARLAEPPGYQAAEAKYWTLDEARRFLAAIPGHRLYAAFLLIVLYGLREGETLGLRWVDVDFSEGVLHIRQQLQQINNELVQCELKTKASRRDEALVGLAADALAARRAAMIANGESIEGLVFTGATGKPLWPRNFMRCFRRICANEGLRPIKIHELRHTNATLLKKLGVPDRDIQAILGHSDPATTRRLYQHVDETDKNAALAKLEELFIPAPAPVACRQELPSKWQSVVGFTKNTLVAPPRLELGTQGSSGVGRTAALRRHDFRNQSDFTKSYLLNQCAPKFGERVREVSWHTNLARTQWLLGVVAVINCRQEPVRELVECPCCGRDIATHPAKLRTTSPAKYVCSPNKMDSAA
ncbi:tyrosine-type recombinase/integrase [Fodinicola acaciae]|uniref:tyrosine-type recombinase/integrase n=1 Tax=Fodinicola acaciae TaxID=2681555 RepID=UPI0013D2BC2E|nr:site-specific integrase [Fodinicola acaciae]